MPTILVIDDDEVFRVALAATLQRRGIEVLQATGGAKGVQLARERSPDLILCDVNMEGASGSLTLYALRRDPAVASIPFILMSGSVLSGGAIPGTERGADGFLLKPFTSEKLFSLIGPHLDKETKSPAGREEKTMPSRTPGGNPYPPELPDLLRSLLEVISLLGTDTELESNRRVELATRANHLTLRLQRTTENFLLYAQIERLTAHRRTLTEVPPPNLIDLRAVVEPAAMEKARLMGRLSDLDLELIDAPVSITEEHLKKILQELLDNAFTYSRGGSAVLVKTSRLADKVALSISDHGSGMSSEQIAEAGAAVPLDYVLSEKRGSGIGLSIARRLAEFYGGALHIESESGKGTTVIVMLSHGK